MGFARKNIINDGTTGALSALGAMADFELALRRGDIDDDVMVVAGDMLFNPASFDLGLVVHYFQAHKGDVACYYEMEVFISLSLSPPPRKKSKKKV